MAGSGGESIDFASLAAALLDRAELLVPQWLPGGKRAGAEWVCGDLTGAPGGSCSVNLRTGAWADFSGDDRGSDLISLYAAIRGLNNGQAARELMRDQGWDRAARLGGGNASNGRADTQRETAPDGRPEPPPSDEHEAAPAGRRKSLWRAIAPVPDGAPEPDFKHWQRGLPARYWEYRYEGALYGYVCRFETSDGGKEILPYTWCVDESDGRGTRRWHWKQWDEPRPLYVPATLLAGDPALVPVVLVEGEKCALAGHELLGHEFDFVSWPGGGKAWAKADWSWLRGRVVYLWPDRDAKRRPLTREEREAGVDPATKELLPEAQQPGLRAMVQIGSLLAADFGCQVLLCPLPKPGAVADGWDIADAIAAGWDAEMVRGFIRRARVFEPPDDAARAKAHGASTPTTAGAAPEEAARAWRGLLLQSGSGAIKAVRENVVLALDGRADKGVPGIPEAAGVIAFNEFTNDVIKLADTPWGTAAGVWDEVDELEMGHWLTAEHWLPSMPRGTLEEAVLMVAKRHRYHPVRARLERVRGSWDRTPRLRTWLRRVCLVEDEFDDEAPLQQYLARAGTWFVMALAQRVLAPGCKFDYMLIFEGPQGVGKSTLASVLGGGFYADTGLVLGEKDSYQNLQGVHVYEWGELDSLSRADVRKVKNFISSEKDRFRASFDRRAKDYPRQVVFVGTTNEDRYLSDPTGNRRFWPVHVTRERADVDWLRANLDQLYAEALVYLEAGERFHPTPREQRELFDPQQELRTVDSALEAAIVDFLYNEKQRVHMGGENGTLVNTISLAELLHRVGYPLDKRTDAVMRSAAASMRRLGWQLERETCADLEGKRSYRYKRPPRGSAAPGGSERSTPAPPAPPSPQHDAAASPARATDDCPF